jgi:hypothetical protein
MGIDPVHPLPTVAQHHVQLVRELPLQVQEPRRPVHQHEHLPQVWRRPAGAPSGVVTLTVPQLHLVQP